tara:strand:- start:2484 stop:3098 length:615 start_codon:yes stop_codon:yes gene_type:complete
METLIIVLSWGGSATLILGKIIYSKGKYKKIKKNIYKTIKLAKEHLDEELLIKGIELLKELDRNNKNLLTGEMKRGFLEVIQCKSVLAKMDKLEKLFGLSYDNVKDENSIRKFIQKQKIIKENEKNEMLGKKSELKIKLEQTKNKQLIGNKSNRQIIDHMNLTEIIKKIHQDYEVLFIDTFREKIVKDIKISEEENAIIEEIVE